ncbi:helix-turn-helix domain-containing protein [Pontiella sulfatireligans]|uniref:helix-turn-helix domain-containing protein n=1 Tax=Pontiella sulfatireligans TaxID=2750658 RepID=UPI00109CD0E1
MPGILPYRRSTEHFRRQVYLDHRDGISREQLRRNCRIETATVERWFHDHLDPGVLTVSLFRGSMDTLVKTRWYRCKHRQRREAGQSLGKTAYLLAVCRT